MKKSASRITLGFLFLVVLGVLWSVQISKPTDLFAANASAFGSLCGKGEKVIFSCPIKRSTKTLSLCASSNLTKTEGYIQYRFGTPGKIELEYPKDRTSSRNAFSYSHYFRAKVDLTEISFSVDSYTYTVFDAYNAEEKPVVSEQGVKVTNPNTKDVTYSCRTPPKADYADLKEVLKNDSDPLVFPIKFQRELRQASSRLALAELQEAQVLLSLF